MIKFVELREAALACFDFFSNQLYSILVYSCSTAITTVVANCTYSSPLLRVRYVENPFNCFWELQIFGQLKSLLKNTDTQIRCGNKNGYYSSRGETIDQKLFQTREIGINLAEKQRRAVFVETR